VRLLHAGPSAENFSERLPLQPRPRPWAHAGKPKDSQVLREAFAAGIRPMLGNPPRASFRKGELVIAEIVWESLYCLDAARLLQALQNVITGFAIKEEFFDDSTQGNPVEANVLQDTVVAVLHHQIS